MRACAALRDADAVVGDGRDDLAVGDRHGDRDHPAVRAELHGVVEEVDEHLAEPRRVAADQRDDSRDVVLEGHALAVGEQPDAARCVAVGDPAHVDVVEEDLGARRSRSARGRAAR